MIKTHGFRHIQFLVKDAERALAFYSALLGVEEQFRDAGAIFTGVPGGGDMITLNQSPGGRPAGPSGLVHFGFAIPADTDVGAAVAEIETAGGKVLRTGEHEPGKPFIYFNDLDGYEVELFTP